MKRIPLSAIAAALAFAAPVFADDAHHPEQAAQAKGSPATPAPQVKKMQDNVKKMPAQLDRIAKAKTDAERQTAMAEHMRTMQENMGMARAMQADGMGCDMMHGGKMGGGMGMMGKGGMGMMAGEAPAAAAPDRMQQIEKRLDMMQMMMEQMMRRGEGASAPMPMK